MRFQKGNILFPLLAAVALLAVVVGGYFWWQNHKRDLVPSSPPPEILHEFPKLTPTPVLTQIATTSAQTANWKTYRNDKYGFELKYPPDWTVEDSPGLRRNSGDDLIFGFGCPECHEGISIDPANGATIQSLVKDTAFVSDISDITVNGEKGKEVDTTQMGMGYIYIIHNNKIYTFSTGGRMKDEGILSTFKFL